MTHSAVHAFQRAPRIPEAGEDRISGAPTKADALPTSATHSAVFWANPFMVSVLSYQSGGESAIQQPTGELREMSKFIGVREKCPDTFLIPLGGGESNNPTLHTLCYVACSGVAR